MIDAIPFAHRILQGSDNFPQSFSQSATVNGIRPQS